MSWREVEDDTQMRRRVHGGQRVGCQESTADKERSSAAQMQGRQGHQVEHLVRRQAMSADAGATGASQNAPDRIRVGAHAAANWLRMHSSSYSGAYSYQVANTITVTWQIRVQLLHLVKRPPTSTLAGAWQGVPPTPLRPSALPSTSSTVRK